MQQKERAYFIPPSPVPCINNIHAVLDDYLKYD
jgi:hypothetical protein